MAERPATCASCDTRLSRKQWYYRNGQFFCKKRCWNAAQEKAKAESQAGKAKEEAAKAEQAEKAKEAKPEKAEKAESAKAKES